MEYILVILSAAWLGILTSISPCPLATNIAAISFIGRKVDRPGYVLVTGLLYTLGRMLTYVVLAMIIVNSILSMPAVSQWLSVYMNKLIGPILILAAMFLMELIGFGNFGDGLSQWGQKRAEKFGLGGALLLGVVFALTFCPVSAALFFGSLIPLAIDNSSGFVLPLVYGLGTALPVFVFAILIVAGANAVAKSFQKISHFEKWARMATGIIFLLIGIYFTLAHTMQVI